MIGLGICYLRAGDSKGSVLVQPGFERLQYVLLHTSGENPQMYKLKTRGRFQIWTKETLEKYGFAPEHGPYYIVLQFDGSKPIPFKNQIKLTAGRTTYTARLKNFSEFIL